MGTLHYLVRPDRKQMFELGKSAWSLVYENADVRGDRSVPKTYEGWLERVQRYWMAESLDEKEDEKKEREAYQVLMAQALQKFTEGGELFWAVDDSGDGVWEIATYLGYELVGSIYGLTDPKEFERNLKRFNELHARYRNRPDEMRDLQMNWKAMQVMGQPERLVAK